MKKVRKFRIQKKKEWEDMDPERKAEILEARAEPLPIKKQLMTLLWDYKQSQLNEHRMKVFKDLIDIRLKELETDKEIFKNEKITYLNIRGKL